MRVTEVSYSRKYNIGNYESEEYGLVAVVEEGDDEMDVIANLKAEVHAAHVGTPGKVEEKEEEPEEQEEEQPEEEEQEETPEESEEEEQEEEESDDDDKDSEEDAEEEEEVPAKKGKGAKKNFKKKPQAYDRKNETHKEIFSGVLKAVAPDWKKDAKSKAKAKDVSAKMEAADFLDADGEVLPSFQKEVSKLMKAKK